MHGLAQKTTLNSPARLNPLQPRAGGCGEGMGRKREFLSVKNLASQFPEKVDELAKLMAEIENAEPLAKGANTGKIQ